MDWNDDGDQREEEVEEEAGKNASDVGVAVDGNGFDWVPEVDDDAALDQCNGLEATLIPDYSIHLK